jgi:hypothetical protein
MVAICIKTQKLPHSQRANVYVSGTDPIGVVSTFKKKTWIDFEAGRSPGGETMEFLAAEFIENIL